MSRIIITNECKLERTDIYLVSLTLPDGTIIEDLEPRRLFPTTDLMHYITFLNKDEREVALLRDVDELDENSRASLLGCFEDFYLIPKIEEILNVRDKFGALHLTVRTDHGVIKFRIRNRHSDIKQLRGTNRILIRDSSDNRYEIPDVTQLSAKSRRLLFSYT